MNTLIYHNKRIAYQVRGKGFPIVLLHGFCEDSSVWDEFIESLIDDYQIIIMDNPGFGESEVIKTITIREIAEVVKILIDHLNINHCIMIGHSMGGYIALAFAEKYGHYLKGLGMFHSHPAADSNEKKIARQKSVEFIQNNGAIIYVKQLIPKFFAADFAKNNSLLIDKLIYKAAQYDPQGIIAGLNAMKNRTGRTHVLEQLICPALFIIGKKDIAVPAQVSIDQTSAPAIASIHLLPEIAHMGMFEAPKTCAKIIIEFVQFCIS